MGDGSGSGLSSPVQDTAADRRTTLVTSRKRPCCLLRMTLPNSLCRIACATILGPWGSEHGTVRHAARQDSPVGSSDGQGAEARLRDMKIYQSELRTLEGEPFRLPQTQLLLIVNVASKCGLTPSTAAWRGSRKRTPTGGSR